MDTIISFRVPSYDGTESFMLEIKNSKPVRLRGEKTLATIFVKKMRGIKIEDSTKLFKLIRSFEQIAERIAEAQHFNVELEGDYNDAIGW